MLIASDQPKAWSYSALTQFETCPKQHWHYKVKRDVKDEGSEQSTYGVHVHRSAQQYFDNDKKLPLDLVHMKPIFDGYKNTQFDTSRAEIKLAVSPDYEPTGWFYDNVYIRAVVDLLLTKKNIALAVDWKTGKMKPDSEAWQLKLTGCLVMMHEPEIDAVAMRYVWLAHKGQTTKFTLTRAEIPAVMNNFAPRVKAYQEAYKRDDFPARPSGLCKKYCPVTSCPHHGS